MFDEVVICLDGSRFAERIIPCARSVAEAAAGELTFLRVVEHGEDSSAAKRYVQDWAKALKARGKILTLDGDVPRTILAELRGKPGALPAMTTHGRTGIWESLLGSVALGVVRRAGRPVLLFHPQGAAEQEFKLNSLVASLDGSEFSEKILPFAAEIAKSLRLNLELIQALPAADGASSIPAELRGDVMEISYLRRCAGQIEEKYCLRANWDVLHGEPSAAIRSYVEGRPGLILALTSRARPALGQTLFGSVAGELVRHARVPILVYSPEP